MTNNLKELRAQINQANLSLVDFNYHTTRKDHFGFGGVKWHEELGLAIDALTQARDILQGVFDQIVESHNKES